MLPRTSSLGIFWSPKSSLRKVRESSGSTSFDYNEEQVNQQPLAKSLLSAMRSREMLHVLCILVDQELECKLRLLWAVVHFQQECNGLEAMLTPSERRAKTLKIKSVYLQKGSPFEVCDFPHDLVEPEFEPAKIAHYLIATLVNNRTIVEALAQWQRDETGDTMMLDSDNTEEKEDLSQPITAPSPREKEADVRIRLVEQAMGSSRSRNALVSQLLHVKETSWPAKIRFVAACEQAFAIEDGKERMEMVNRIVSIFFEKQAMFKFDITSSSRFSKRIVSSFGETRAKLLQNAVCDVLQEMVNSFEFMQVVTSVLSNEKS